MVAERPARTLAAPGSRCARKQFRRPAPDQHADTKRLAHCHADKYYDEHACPSDLDVHQLSDVISDTDRHPERHSQCHSDGDAERHRNQRPYGYGNCDSNLYGDRNK